MNHFAGPDGVGVWQSFVAMAAIYFVFMIGGAMSYRVPPTGWRAFYDGGSWKVEDKRKEKDA